MKRKFLFLFAVALIGLAVGCSSSSKNNHSASCYQKGMAVSYSLQENGKLTSSNSYYDRDAMTAAHENLPYGTKIAVTNLANGRRVVVTVNDRYVPDSDCIIKLSEKAVKELALSKENEVSIDIITWG